MKKKIKKESEIDDTQFHRTTDNKLYHSSVVLKFRTPSATNGWSSFCLLINYTIRQSSTRVSSEVHHSTDVP